MIAGKKRVTKDSIIGEVIRRGPGAKAVIRQHFGNGCFTCPGINRETISFGAMMHNLDSNIVVEELNAQED